mgnify:CR=1 FL=1
MGSKYQSLIADIVMMCLREVKLFEGELKNNGTPVWSNNRTKMLMNNNGMLKSGVKDEKCPNREDKSTIGQYDFKGNRNATGSTITGGFDCYQRIEESEAIYTFFITWVDGCLVPLTGRITNDYK